MRRFSPSLIASLCLSLLSGCAVPKQTYLQPPDGVSDLQIDVDVMECNLLARSLAPTIPISNPPPPQSSPPPGSGFAGGFAHGFAQSMQNAPYYAALRERRRQRAEQEHARRTCLLQRGYTFVEE